jgi:uncharacterized membrane protein YqjE
MDEHENAPAGFMENARRLAATFLGVLHNRLELLSVELQQERVRILEALLLISAIAALGFFTLALLAAALIYLTWNEFGVEGLFILSGAGLVGTLLVFWRLWIRLKDWAFLPGTLAELKKDFECLDNK